MHRHLQRLIYPVARPPEDFSPLSKTLTWSFLPRLQPIQATSNVSRYRDTEAISAFVLGDSRGYLELG